jgi:7-alpha-hydroxysteroid dehydrogenase
VTRAADLEAVVKTALDRFGKLSILVNNAGGGGPKPFDMPMDMFRWAYELNVFSLFRLTQLAAPHMAAAGEGAVLNISSMAGENRNTRMASYASSKAAVNHLTRNIAFDLGAMGIRINAIAPGAIKTDALASVLTPDIETAMLKHTPLERNGRGARSTRMGTCSRFWFSRGATRPRLCAFCASFSIAGADRASW